MPTHYLFRVCFKNILYLCRAVCRKHELNQYELEMAALDLTSKKQQKEELVTGVSPEAPDPQHTHTHTHSFPIQPLVK